MEDVLIEWLDHAIAEPAIEFLPDEAVIALCDLRLDPPARDELNQLFDANREGNLSEVEWSHLDALIQQYRCGLVWKARAWHVAVQRGLKPQLA